MKTENRFNNSSQTNGTDDMETLISRIKAEDLNNLRKMKGLKWMYLIFIIIYTALFILNPDPELGFYHRLSGICYVISFIILWLLFRHYQKVYLQVDYAEPVAAMLRKAAERYKMKIRNFLILFPPLILIDAGLVLSFVSRNPGVNKLEVIGWVQAFYIPIILISGFIGIMFWRKKQKPLYLEALSLLKELE
jgi:hypothetical protein